MRIFFGKGWRDTPAFRQHSMRNSPVSGTLAGNASVPPVVCLTGGPMYGDAGSLVQNRFFPAVHQLGTCHSIDVANHKMYNRAVVRYSIYGTTPRQNLSTFDHDRGSPLVYLYTNPFF